jgi:membrane fusion protein (multidrug efflux system)
MSQVGEIDVLEETRDTAPERKSPKVAAPQKPQLSRWIFGLVVVAAVAGGVYWWIQSQGYESTDDSQIEGHLDSISSRISGTVTYINRKVENNQMVEAGTLLMELDPRDFEAELEQAKATLDTRSAEARSAQVNVPITTASAFGQLRSAEAAKAQAEASVDTEQANLAVARHKLDMDQAIAERAERDRVRYQALVDKREISRSEYDGRATDAVAAQQTVESDRAAIAAAEQRITEAKSLVTQREALIDAAQTAPQQVTDAKAKSASAIGQVERARADVRAAQLNVEYTKIYAPVSGVIGRKTVELGHRVQPGQGLMVIVPVDDIWVTANFKETQMKKIRPGQSVDIYVDTFGRSFKGKVENLPGAAGPLFSLFPPENSSGNYVKVVQRFPVRIRFDKDQDPEHLLRPGMSVEPTVTVR